jgi:hypothetical protein
MLTHALARRGPTPVLITHSPRNATSLSEVHIVRLDEAEIPRNPSKFVIGAGVLNKELDDFVRRNAEKYIPPEWAGA